MSDRLDQLKDALQERVLCLDGATGTWLQDQELSAQDFGGEPFEGCNEHLVLTRPDVILELHRSYLRAGADIVETNSFGSTAVVLAEYPPLQEQAYEISKVAAQLAREAAAEFDGEGRTRFVAGSMGPTTKALSVTGGITFTELQDTFLEQARGLIDGGADYLLLETCQDTRNVKAGLLAVEQLERERGHEIGLAVSGTIEPTGTMLAGQSAEALVISMQHRDLLYLGLNCATGPELMTDHLRAMSELARTRVGCVPNAGLPDEDGLYVETPDMLGGVLARFLSDGWLNVIGGCCGTTPAHIEHLVALASQATPRAIPTHQRAFYSGIDWVESTEDNRPLLVGERTNVIGSRRFKRLIVSEEWEEATEVGTAQVRKGAQIVDVCLANPDRDELHDTERFLEMLCKRIKVPLMIDSTDAEVIEHALGWCQGKSIINSVNLEDGEERFEQIVPLARRFGAALVVGCIDDDPIQGMGVTAARKLEIAQRSADLLTGKYGIPLEDLIFDPLVFPCGTGDAQYLRSAGETVEGVRLIKEALPQAKTVLGISNVSFGLPPAGREVLNSVFLYECTKAGLDMAIVNTEKLERYASIPPEERALSEEILFRTTDAAVAEFTAHFRDSSSRIVVEVSTLSLDERLSHYVVEGTKQGLIPDLEEKLRDTPPMDIINGPLMTGMEEVGRLFNDRQLIVAEVLQSAEVMKAAVNHLEPLMEKSAATSRGKIILATVKGDVHDIGKNLVDIILSNNGYEVIDLGIKVPPHNIIEAVREHKPDIVGLSGLLVKSAQMMVTTAIEMTDLGVTPDLLVGGAALSRNFTGKRIAAAYGGNVLYAEDAMDGLRLVNELRSDDRRQDVLDQWAAQTEKMQKAASDSRKARARSGPSRSTAVIIPALESIPRPPDFDRHLLEEAPLGEIWGWINPRMLYGKHLGLRGDFDAKIAARDPRALQLREVMWELQGKALGGAMTASAVWQWFECDQSDGVLHIYRQGESEAAVDWALPPGRDGHPGLCGYVRKRGAGGGRDNLALFAVSAGAGIRAQAAQLREEGEYLRSHAIQSLALETAEALAEWLHAKIRAGWGFPDPEEMTMIERFKARYHGKRFSPGYPACPDLSLQDGFWTLLRPEEVGIELTESHTMDPEASVSALVLHHPDAKYFASA
jgi:5-methyltetrahydrofolate--homocysteine methyltransferase